MPCSTYLFSIRQFRRGKPGGKTRDEPSERTQKEPRKRTQEENPGTARMFPVSPEATRASAVVLIAASHARLELAEGAEDPIPAILFFECPRNR
jgi:hypothetical protein